jgi:hypothetical protein
MRRCPACCLLSSCDAGALCSRRERSRVLTSKAKRSAPRCPTHRIDTSQRRQPYLPGYPSDRLPLWRELHGSRCRLSAGIPGTEQRSSTVGFPKNLATTAPRRRVGLRPHAQQCIPIACCTAHQGMQTVTTSIRGPCSSGRPGERRLCGDESWALYVADGSGCDGRAFGFIARKPALKVRCR